MAPPTRRGAVRSVRVRIIREFPAGRLEKSKEFLTEVAETMHRGHGEVPEMFSVCSVVGWFKDTDILITP